MTVTTKKKKRKLPVQDENKVGKSLTLKQELFCQMYVNNTECFDNGTLSYATAYGVDLDSLSKEPVYEEQYDDVNERTKMVKIEDSPYDKACKVCGVCASKLLRNARIDERVKTIMRESLTDKRIDEEMLWVVSQRKDLSAKAQIIKEYNKMKGRVIERQQIDVTGLDLKSIIETI
jgi:hypothetical protein